MKGVQACPCAAGMAAEASATRSRAAYRAVYLAAPLKFNTSLHAFGRPQLPRLFVDTYKADPHAKEKRKWRIHKEAGRGRFSGFSAELEGDRKALEGWPDPRHLGASELVHVAARAQADGLTHQAWWHEVAERAHVSRDVLSVADVATILDALVTADLRHSLLLKSLIREIVDDADKLSLTEAAVVANAFSHFQCFSKDLMVALEAQVIMLLTGADPPYVRGGQGQTLDPGRLAVLARAFVGLGYRSERLFAAFGKVAVDLVDELSFPVVAALVTSFAKGGYSLQADPAFWATVAHKAEGCRLAAGCQVLSATANLGIAEGPLRQALVAEITRGLQAEPAGSQVPSPPIMQPRPFAGLDAPRNFFAMLDPKAMPRQLAAEDPAGAPDSMPEDSDAQFSAAPFGRWPEEVGEDGAMLAEAAGAVPGGEAKRPTIRPRWYNPVSRRPLLPSAPKYCPFDANLNFERNRRGAVLGDAMEGLCEFWRRGGARAAPADDEFALLAAALPVLTGSLQGLSPSQLAATAHAYARTPRDQNSHALLEGLAREAMRRLATLQVGDLRRLNAALELAGLEDPLMEKAKRRRFPAALRKELKEQRDAARAAAKAPGPTPVGPASVGAAGAAPETSPVTPAAASADPQAKPPKLDSKDGGEAKQASGSGPNGSDKRAD